MHGRTSASQMFAERRDKQTKKVWRMKYVYSNIFQLIYSTFDLTIYFSFGLLCEDFLARFGGIQYSRRYGIQWRPKLL